MRGPLRVDINAALLKMVFEGAQRPPAVEGTVHVREYENQTASAPQHTQPLFEIPHRVRNVLETVRGDEIVEAPVPYGEILAIGEDIDIG
jgi:hypothetical protein